MDNKTFKIPLIGTKKNIAAPNCAFDFKSIGKIRRQLFGDNIFGIKPDPPSELECG